MAGQVSGAVVEVAVRGAALAQMAAVLSRPDGIMDRIGRHLVASTLRRFETERAPDGSPWLKSARAIAEGNRTLTDTGRLRRSIAHVVGDGGHTVEVGSNVVYAAIHQLGGRAGKGRQARIPARPYLGIDERDRDAIARIVTRALEGAGA